MAFVPSSNSLVAQHARLSPALLSRRGVVLARPSPTWRQAKTILGAFNDQSSSSPSPSSPASKPLRDSVPFEIRGISLPLVVFTLGVLLTGSSFFGYFMNSGGSDGAFSSLGFVYGIPVFLIGLSLWYAEIKPVPVLSDVDGDKVWEQYATTTLRQIRQDVTRHRYGDDAHLDTTLNALGLKLPQRKYPKLVSLRTQRAVNGQLDFVLTFQSLETPYKVWSDPQRLQRFHRFFGPNVKASVTKVDSAQRLLALTLTTISPEEYSALLAEPPVEETVVGDDNDNDDKDDKDEAAPVVVTSPAASV
eukprot:scaffold865_cov160-Ochromonas_danica.AAC.2